MGRRRGFLGNSEDTHTQLLRCFIYKTGVPPFPGLSGLEELMMWLLGDNLGSSRFCSQFLLRSCQVS